MTGLESFLLSYFAGKILDVSLSYSGDRVLTKPQKKKLNSIIQHCLEKVVKEHSLGRTDDELLQLKHSLEYLLNQQHVLEYITPAVFASDSPQGFGAVDEIVGYNEGMVTSHQATIVRQLKLYLWEALTSEASIDGSPLHNAVAISKLGSLEGSVDKIGQQMLAINDNLQPVSAEVSKIGEETSEILEFLRRQESAGQAKLAELEHVKTLLSGEVQPKLDELLHIYRTGKRAVALQALSDICGSEHWRYLDNPTKANVLRRKATWELNQGTAIPVVKDIAAQAIDLDPDADCTVLQSSIAYHEFSYREAIKLVSEPRNAHAWNFLLALKLNHESPAAVLDAIKSRPTFGEGLAETKRLHALALLFSGSPTEALLKLDEVDGREQEWRDVKLARALAIFWKNIGEKSIPEVVPQCPLPLDVELRDIDEESKRLIKSQFEVFWADALYSDIDDEEKVSVHIWALACLIYGGATPQEVSATFSKLIEEHPVDPRVLWWGMCVDKELVTHDLVVEASEALDTDDVNYVQKVNLLIPILLEYGMYDQTLALLELSEDKFSNSENRRAWVQRKAQYFAKIDLVDEALKLTKDDCVDELQTRISVLHIAVQNAPENYLLPLAQDALRLFQEHQNGHALSQVLAQMADMQEWQAISSLFGSDTPNNLPLDAAEIIAIAMYNGGRLEDCRVLLEDIRSRFTMEQFSIHVIRLLIHMAYRRSSVLEELEYARALDDRSSLASDKLLYMRTLLANGFREKVLVECSSFAERNDATKADLLGLAQIIKRDHRTLAISIVKRLLPLISRDDGSVAIVSAYNLCFELGLEAHAGELHKLVAEIAKDPNDTAVRMGSINQVIDLQQVNRENSREQFRLYSKGLVSLHSIASKLSASVSALVFENKEKSDQLGLSNLTPIYIRHGATVSPDEDLVSIFDRELILDTSAILIADAIGALQIIVNRHRSKLLPPSIHAVLKGEIDSFPSVQASRIESGKKILEYVWCGRIEHFPNFDRSQVLTSRFEKWMGRDWVALLNHCVQTKAFLVDYLPLTRNDGSTKIIKQIRKQVREVVVDPRGIIDSLYQSGRISDSRHLAALSKLGPDNKPGRAENLPPLGSTLYCVFNTIEVLQNTGLFGLIISEFRLRLDPSFFEEIKAILRGEWQGLAHRDWLLELQHGLVVRDQSEANYSYLTLSKERKRDLLSSPLISLEDALTAEGDNDTVCWIDDRFVHSFRSIEGKLVVTTYEMLRSLYLCKDISPQEYFGFLHKLRRMNCKYIPLDPEELFFHVSQAKAGDRHLLETEEMVTLRRYYNSCLASWNNLQLSPLPENCPNQHGELYFLHEYNRSISSTIAKIWLACSESDFQHSTQKANWVFDALYTGTYGIRHLRMGSDHVSEAARIDELAVDAGLELMQVLVNVFESNGFQTLKNYQAWVTERLVDPICQANAESANVIASMITAFLKKDFTSADAGKEELKILRNILHFFVDGLPGSIKNLVLEDDEVAEFCGIRVSPSVGIGGFNFEPKKFWQACAKTWAGKKPYIRNFDGSNRFKFSRSGQGDGPENTINIKPNGLPVFAFTSPIIPILDATKDEIEYTLNEAKDWLDISAAEVARLVKKLDVLQQAEERGECLGLVTQRSMVEYYNQLNETLAASNSLSIDALVPSDPAALIGHLRLNGQQKSSVKRRLENSAAILVAENGLKTAFDRLGGLPLQLPEVLINAFDETSAGDRYDLLNELTLTCQSPVHQIQILALSARYSDDDEFGNLFNANWNMLHDLDAWNNKVASFEALLTLLDKALGANKEFRLCDSDVQHALLWVHAAKVLNYLIQNRMALSSGAQFFSKLGETLGKKSFFSMKLADELDILSPELFGNWDFITQLLPALISAYSRDWPRVVNDFYQSALFPEQHEEKSVSLALVFDPSSVPNLLKSPLGFDRVSVLAPFLTSREQKLLSPSNIKKSRSRLISELSETPTEMSRWSAFFMHARNGLFSTDTRNELLTFARSLNLDQLARSSPEALFAALSMMPKLIFQTGDTEAAEHFRRQIILLTEQFESYGFDNEEDEAETFDRAVVSAIENALITLSSMQETPWAQGKQFSQDLYEIYDNLSRYYPEMSYALSTFILKLPITQTNGLWETLIAIRSRT